MIARLLEALRTPSRVDPQIARAERKRERAEQRERLRVERREAEAARRRQRREAAERARQEMLGREAAAAQAYEHYLRLRPWAEHLSQESRTVPLTVAEQCAVDAVRTIWNATPEAIATLRHWCDPLSGVHPDAYQDGSSELGKRLRRDLKRLFAEMGRDLFVPESPLLGGFGFETDGKRYNEDTLRFFNALMGLHDGGVLSAFRAPARRHVVWDIAGGWGGFAYQFKTICPNTTYLITGAPEVLLIAAIYLMTVFPGARLRLHGDGSGGLWDGWEETDFVLVPEAALADLRPPRLDLAIDNMAMKDMTRPRMASHVQWAHDRGCRYFYSLHRGGFSYDAMPEAWMAIGARYWLHPVPPRLELDKAVVQIDYSNLIAWARLRV